MTPALKIYIESWLEKAGHDLISAQRLLEITEAKSYYKLALQIQALATERIIFS